ncbi:MAG: hypothetical protein AB1499_03425 [Nitrospirota bacterium]
MGISKRHVIAAHHFRGFDKQDIFIEVRFNFTKAFALTAQAGIVVPALISLA